MKVADFTENIFYPYKVRTLNKVLFIGLGRCYFIGRHIKVYILPLHRIKWSRFRCLFA